ncbi:MAG: tRNA pseudouridine(13) synthase TruD [Planctomycetota bacterium]|nr:tRNA pseudouridine(13) synthase TruD [Planctomycetota bacterium]
MRLKSKPTDFKVDELLRDDYLVERGEYRVYKVTKRKVTSLEAARALSDLTGVGVGDVSMAGLKDRQGVTQQYMSVRRGKVVSLRDGGLEIETVGYGAHELSANDSLGNAFRLVVRELDDREVRRLHASLPDVREYGLPNYFDEQRFGNLRHNQGWVMRELIRGGPEAALKRLLTAVSDHDDRRSMAFKSALHRHWGDWHTCRDIAGRFGQHHSVFEHLKQHDEFAGAFRHVATRIRLIHLFAWQSHLWNRALAAHFDRACSESERFTMRAREGKLVFPKGELPLPPTWGGMLPLPGERLQGVELADQRELFAAALKPHKVHPDQLDSRGVPGLALKADPRAVRVIPGDLRVRPSEPDPLHRGKDMVRISFTLPRGSYATLVVRRLIGPPRPTSPQ